MRVFIAVFPPPAVQDAAWSVIEALRPGGGGVSWVKRENLHYTMRFLGEIGEDGTRRVIAAAKAAAAAAAAFPAEMGNAGAFPSARRARVLWLGLATGGPQLVLLAKRLDAELDKRGWKPEGRGFSPHLTIGRVREPSADWTAALAETAIPAGAARDFTVDRLDVVRSQLNPRGSVYTVVESAPLSLPA